MPKLVCAGCQIIRVGIKLFCSAGVMIACFSILAVGCSDDRGKTTDPLTQLDQSPASDLRPDGELAEILAIGSTYTNVQRENNLLQVRGKTVQWNLPVYDVKRHGAGYRVQTIGEQIAILESRKLIAGAMVYITPRTDAERLELEAFRTGDIISFKGVIHDITLRTVEISPARLTPYPYLSVGAALSSQSLREDASSLLAQEEDQELRIAFGLEERNTKGRLTIYHIANNSKTDYLKNLFESDIRPVTIGKLSGYTAPALKLKIGGVTVQQYAVAFFREKVDGKINFGLFVDIDGAESAKRIWCGLVSSERKSLKIEIVGPTHWAGFTATKLLKLPTDVNLNCQ